MKKSDMWIAAAASLGVGAATFYAMSKSDKPLNKAMESVTPILSNLTSSSGGSATGNSMAGNNQMSGGMTNMSQNGQTGQQTNHQSPPQTETMGPFGMS